MFWQKKEPEFSDMDSLIQQNPGIRPAEIAGKLNVSRSTVTRRLPSLEEAGYHYFEDEEGGLWPFDKGK
jgi:DNA-binding MarR family transcriptional regulator